METELLPLGPNFHGNREDYSQEEIERFSRAYMLADPTAWLKEALPEWPFISMKLVKAPRAET